MTNVHGAPFDIGHWSLVIGYFVVPARRSLPQRVSDSFRVIKELDLSHQYERQAGTIVLLLAAAGIVVAAVAGGWLASEKRPVPVVVDFSAAQGLVGGDAVVMAGVPVGRVRRVELVESGRVRVSLVVQRRHRPRRDAQFEIRPVNMLGDVAVSYRPGSDSAFAPQGTVLAGRARQDFATRALALRETAAEVAVSARAFLRPDFRADVTAARRATDRARAALAGVRDAPLEALDEALAAGQHALASLDSLMQDAALDSARARLRGLGEQADGLLAGVTDTRERLAAIQARMDSGQGNVGLALRDRTLRRELDATRRSLDDLLFKYLGRRPGPRSRADSGPPAGGDSIR
jgi:phospholipid/cholesterol/gamma-HCH transport system substrate-binding protein